MQSDQKHRWGGLLENPVISTIQRNMLDAGRNQGIQKSLAMYSFDSVIDVGCGLGETSEIFSCPYTGIDNSLPRIEHASKKYAGKEFFLGNAHQLSFPEDAFDAGVMIDTSHHLTDEMFHAVLRELLRVCKRYVIISDPVYFNGQNFVSRCFYSLDRGGCFRTEEQMKTVFQQVSGNELERCECFTTFPGIYRHSVFILRIT